MIKQDFVNTSKVVENGTEEAKKIIETTSKEILDLLLNLDIHSQNTVINDVISTVYYVRAENIKLLEETLALVRGNATSLEKGLMEKLSNKAS